MRPFAFDHRADVVEDGAAQEGRARGRKRHGEEPAARGADERRLRRSPAAVSTCKTSPSSTVRRRSCASRCRSRSGRGRDSRGRARAAGRLLVLRQGQREVVEIRRGARQSRQADDRQGRARARPVVAGVEPQAVGRGDEEIRVIGHAARRRAVALAGAYWTTARPPRKSLSESARCARRGGCGRPAGSPSRAARSCASRRTGCARPSRPGRPPAVRGSP